MRPSITVCFTICLCISPDFNKASLVGWNLGPGRRVESRSLSKTGQNLSYLTVVHRYMSDKMWLCRKRVNGESWTMHFV
jgi:hypothetical protein